MLHPTTSRCLSLEEDRTNLSGAVSREHGWVPFPCIILQLLGRHAWPKQHISQPGPQRENVMCQNNFPKLYAHKEPLSCQGTKGGAVLLLPLCRSKETARTPPARRFQGFPKLSPGRKPKPLSEQSWSLALASWLKLRAPMFQGEFRLNLLSVPST